MKSDSFENLLSECLNSLKSISEKLKVSGILNPNFQKIQEDCKNE